MRLPQNPNGVARLSEAAASADSLGRVFGRPSTAERALARSTVPHISPQPIKQSVLNRLGDVMGLDTFGSLQVGDGP